MTEVELKKSLKLDDLEVGEKFGENGTVIDRNDNSFSVIEEEEEEHYLDSYKIRAGTAKRRSRQKITEERYNRYISRVKK